MLIVSFDQTGPQSSSLLLKKIVVVPFDSGYEVWVERDRSDSREADMQERVILIDPAGVVAKARVGLPYAGRR